MTLNLTKIEAIMPRQQLSTIVAAILAKGSSDKELGEAVTAAENLINMMQSGDPTDGLFRVLPDRRRYGALRGILS